MGEAALTAGVLVLAVVCAAATFVKVRPLLRVDPLYVWGSVAAVAGLIGSDAMRFFADRPVASLVLAEVGTLGMILVVRGLYRSWLEMLCEAWILAGGLTLVPLLTAMLVHDVPDTLIASVDVTQLSLAIFAWAGPQRLLSEALSGRRTAHHLAAVGLLLRALVWLAQAAATSFGLAAGHTVAVGLLLLGYLLWPPTVVALSRAPWRPDYRTALVPSARAPYVVMIAALTVLLVSLAVEPQSRRFMTLVLAGGCGAALLVRQMVTNLRLQETMAAAHRQEKYFRTLVQDVQDVVMICDDAGHLEYVSPAAARVLPADVDHATATLHRALGCPAETVEGALREARHEGSSRFEVRHDARVLETSVGSRRSGFVLAVRDVTERDQLRERLHSLAYEDGLTGLPNRRLLLDRLDTRLERGLGSGLAVLFVDLDRFKQVNDSSGHHAGDELLQEVARRIVSVVGAEPLLARLGGDEFVVVVEGDEDRALTVARHLHAAIMQPFTIGMRVHQVGASVGVAVAEPGADAITLLQRADLAMYAAKQHGSPWRVFTHDLKDAADRRADADHEMARTWGREAVRVHLQPIVRTTDLRVHSAEALLRWQAEDGTLLGPDRPLDYAARTGQMTQLASWTLAAALATLRRVDGDVPVAVNAAPSLLHLPDLAGRLRRAVERHGLTPRHVHLELTEDALVDDRLLRTDVFEQLHREGFTVSVDDFGTGYSSLSYLVRLPIDGIKIDRAFVRELPTSVPARSIVASMVGFARDLDVDLVAEGVETEEEAAWVHRLGVPLAQGYWYARPRDSSLLRRLDDLREWADDRGEGGRHTDGAGGPVESFALEGGEC